MSAEARERIAAWVKEIQAAKADKRAADALADRQSLDRAADLEEIYAEMAWIDEMPSPKRKKLGRRINPKSREQFAKWVKLTFDWGSPVRLSHLHTAHDLVPHFLNAVKGIQPSGEWSLRPLARLRAEGYSDYQIEVWQAAVKIADGDAPTASHVRRAVNEFLERHKPPVRNLAADPRTAEEKRAARRAQLLAEFDEILADENRAAKELLNEMVRHFNDHQRALRESA